MMRGGHRIWLPLNLAGVHLGVYMIESGVASSKTPLCRALPVRTDGDGVCAEGNATGQSKVVGTHIARLVDCLREAPLGTVAELPTHNKDCDAMAGATNPSGDGKAVGRTFAACQCLLHEDPRE